MRRKRLESSAAYHAAAEDASQEFPRSRTDRGQVCARGTRALIATTRASGRTGRSRGCRCGWAYACRKRRDRRAPEGSGAARVPTAAVVGVRSRGAHGCEHDSAGFAGPRLAARGRHVHSNPAAAQGVRRCGGVHSRAGKRGGARGAVSLASLIHGGLPEMPELRRRTGFEGAHERSRKDSEAPVRQVAAWIGTLRSPAVCSRAWRAPAATDQPRVHRRGIQDKRTVNQRVPATTCYTRASLWSFEGQYFRPVP